MRKIFLLLFSILILVTNSYAFNIKKANQVVSKLTKKVDNIFTLKVLFINEYKDSLLGGGRKLKGKFLFKIPSLYYLDYGNMKIISRGVKVYKINNIAKQIVINKLDSSNILFSLKKYYKKIINEYKLLDFEENKKEFIFSYSAKNDNSYIRYVQFNIRKKDLMPTQVVFKDINGNINIYTITYIEMNKKIDDKIFNLSFPKDYEVIDLTK